MKRWEFISLVELYCSCSQPLLARHKKSRQRNIVSYPGGATDSPNASKPPPNVSHSGKWPDRNPAVAEIHQKMACYSLGWQEQSPPGGPGTIEIHPEDPPAIA
jgi:hypothetical protein